MKKQTLIILAVIAFLSLLPYVIGDCNDCCSSNGTCSRAFHRQQGVCCGVIKKKPYCCPAIAECVHRGNSRFGCKIRSPQRGALTEPKSPSQPQPGHSHLRDRPSDDRGWADWHGSLITAIGICLAVPCCCFLGHYIYRRRQRQSLQNQADAARWVHAPPMSPQQVEHSPYAAGSVPRAPPNTPVGMYSSMSQPHVAYPVAYPPNMSGPGASSGPSPLRPFEGESHRMEGEAQGRPTTKPSVDEKPRMWTEQPAHASYHATESTLHPVAEPTTEATQTRPTSAEIW